MSLSPLVKTGILVAFGVLFAAAGLLTYFLFPDLLKSQVKKRLVLSPTSETYEQWKEPSLPIYLSIYVFNITNPVEVYNGTSYPVFEELGPYVFREVRRKQNITWNENGTVSFRLYKKYYFQPDRTNGTLDDRIVTANVPLLTMASIAKKKNESTVALFMSEVFHFTNSSLFVEKRVRELLFEGYVDPLFELAMQILPDKVKSPRFGFFYGKNDSDDGHLYTMYTGESDIQKFGYMERWNGNDTVIFWDEPCEKVEGSTGEMWPPFRENKYEKLTLFVPDVCRSLSLRYISEHEVKGIEAYRYWLDNTAFDNGKYNREHKCYCRDKCLPAGGHDVSRCQQDAPIVMSFPHFLYGDIEYTENIIGMKPDPKKHLFYIDLQPEMGLPIGVDAKLQINIAAEPLEGVLALLSVKKTTYYPILWFGQTAEVNDELAKQILLVTQDLPYYATVVSFSCIVIGGVFLTFAIVCAMQFMKAKKKNDNKGVYAAVKVVKS